VAEVIVTPRARQDVEEAISKLKLPSDTWTRVVCSLRVLETFPLAGRTLGGRWAGTRFVLGPWPWMIVLYRYEKEPDRAYVVAVHDGRSVASASGSRR
jgi:plasmid stabilization system protein ParE